MKLNKNTVIFIILIIGLMLTGCTSNIEKNNVSGKVNGSSSSEKNIAIDKLEIYHFHGTNQCSSCITMGDYAEETVNTYFKDELEEGIIVFDHINGELPENKELVVKYGVTGSSLWLGTYDGDNFTAEQNIQVWYKINNKQDCMNYLKGVIEQKLAGK